MNFHLHSYYEAQVYKKIKTKKLSKSKDNNMTFETDLGKSFQTVR